MQLSLSVVPPDDDDRVVGFVRDTVGKRPEDAVAELGVGLVHHDRVVLVGDPENLLVVGVGLDGARVDRVGVELGFDEPRPGLLDDGLAAFALLFALDDLARPFVEAGAAVETRLVFGKDRAAAIDGVMREEDCAAELTPAPTESIERILVPIPDVAEFDRLPRFVDVFCEDSTAEITLFHVVEGEEERERGEAIVEETRAGLVESGFDADTVDARTVESDAHDEEILRVADEYGAVVMYEADSNLGDRIFGTLPDRIARDTGDPVIVVRRDY